MSGGHTPGPWSAEPDTMGNVEIFSRAKGDCTRLIADVFEEDMGSILPQRANARLMAAAPELLEMAMQLVAALDGAKTDYDELAGLARAAIAKATLS